MKWLHSDIMTEKPMLKKLIILLVAVNAIVLAILLFGPSKESDASVRNTGNAGGNEQNAVVANSSEESEDEDSEEDRDSDDEDRNADDEDRNTDEEDRDDGEDSYGQDTEDSEENGGYAEDGDDEQEEDSDSWPKLELTDDHITLNVGEEFDYLKYIKTMEDRDGSSLSRYIHLSEVVNTWMPGEYTVTYTITSPIDGQSDSEDLHVTVE